MTRKTPLRRSGRLRPMSKKRQRQARAYSLLRAAFLKAHPWCAVWDATGGYHGTARATEIHHKAGRTGGNYLNTDTWAAVSRDGHRWIHAHPSKARELGLLAKATASPPSTPVSVPPPPAPNTAPLLKVPPAAS